MNAGYRLTRAAVDDILAIHAFGVKQFGLEQADAYHDLLERTFEFLAANPFAARQRLELAPAVRVHPLQSHLVIYQLEDDGRVLIIRVRHAHEDWADPDTAP